MIHKWARVVVYRGGRTGGQEKGGQKRVLDFGCCTRIDRAAAKRATFLGSARSSEIQSESDVKGDEKDGADDNDDDDPDMGTSVPAPSSTGGTGATGGATKGSRSYG